MSTEINISDVVRLQSDVIEALTRTLSSQRVVGKTNTEIVQMLAQEAVHSLMISDVVKTEYKEWYVLGELVVS